jgi:hypothetical protein
VTERDRKKAVRSAHRAHLQRMANISAANAKRRAAAKHAEKQTLE